LQVFFIYTKICTREKKKKKEAEQYGRFLKMIDDLQTQYTKPIILRVLSLLF